MHAKKLLACTSVYRLRAGVTPAPTRAPLAVGSEELVVLSTSKFNFTLCSETIFLLG